jgi:hypothetical protein
VLQCLEKLHMFQFRERALIFAALLIPLIIFGCLAEMEKLRRPGTDVVIF